MYSASCTLRRSAILTATSASTGLHQSMLCRRTCRLRQPDIPVPVVSEEDDDDDDDDDDDGGGSSNCPLPMSRAVRIAFS